MKRLQATVLRSVGTVRNYEQALTQVARHCIDERTGLRDLTPNAAVLYLQWRGEEVGQKTLDMERQAIQAMMQHVTHALDVGKHLPVVRSEHEQALSSRAYTAQQVSLIVEAQSPRNALSTELAYSAGLRAHELLTLLPADEQQAHDRPALPGKFEGREGGLYTVVGKGGLVREVLLPDDLAQRLEALRLDAPREVTDRNIRYEQHYNINGGNRWSGSFTNASKRALGWSQGAHGVRHSYAQERMIELQQCGLDRGQALETVSQEMGHFRPGITEVYLR